VINAGWNSPTSMTIRHPEREARTSAMPVCAYLPSDRGARFRECTSRTAEQANDGIRLCSITDVAMGRAYSTAGVCARIVHTTKERVFD
jgi:hypothetical protein